jgi:hydroxymethylbilane synthase
MPSSPVRTGCRTSKLSIAQFHELQALLPFELEAVPVTTIGDRDRSTSLRSLDKTDFFTRDIDEMQLAGRCRLSLHSAKDLPDPIPDGLTIAAITEGVDRSDSLVLRPRETLQPGMRIGSSSPRREEACRTLEPNLTFVDIRGVIEERLALLNSGLDGVVIAEAALVRLRLTHLNRITLPGDTTPLQGQLAVLVREGDHEMLAHLAPLDTRPLHRTLNLGITHRPGTIHYPIIRTTPREIAIPPYTHLIFTSKTAVRYFPETPTGAIIAVGQATAATVNATHVAANECAEGVIDILETLDLSEAHVLWPHSALSRPLITDYLRKRGIRFDAPILYDTEIHRPYDPPPLEPFDEILFTSPSTVAAFKELFGAFPDNCRLTPIGDQTAAALPQTNRRVDQRVSA